MSVFASAYTSMQYTQIVFEPYLFLKIQPLILAGSSFCNKPSLTPHACADSCKYPRQPSSLTPSGETHSQWHVQDFIGLRLPHTTQQLLKIWHESHSWPCEGINRKYKLLGQRSATRFTGLIWGLPFSPPHPPLLKSRTITRHRLIFAVVIMGIPVLRYQPFT